MYKAIVCYFISLMIAFPWEATAQQQTSRTLVDSIRARFQQLLLPQPRSQALGAATEKPLTMMREKLDERLRRYEPGFSNSDRVVVELQQRAPLNPARLDAYLRNLDDQGLWRDINYKDKKRSGWEPRLHAERILEMVKAFHTLDTPYFHSPALENAIHRALHYWLTCGLTCANWWYSEIGIPRTLGTAMLLFDANLTEEERQLAVEFMKVSHIRMMGQNRVWLAGNVMMRALLENNEALLREARDVIAVEIRTDAAEGIKADWSFHQHGAQQQFGNYGLAYICTMSLYSGLFAGSSLQFTPQQTQTLLHLLNEGYRWIIWRGEMDINALGRQFFRDAPLHKGLSLGFAAMELGQTTWLEDCFGQGSIRPGHKHFFCSDYTLSRRATWMASLKMSSQRVIGAESLNGDNLGGYYGGDGALFIYRDLEPYRRIYPLWDWRRLPGVTAYAHPGAPMPTLNSRRPFTNDSPLVGGLSDGRNGISLMRLVRDGLQADKCWLFLDSVVVCLGAGIASDSTLEVTTAVEQCRLLGEVKRLDSPQEARLWHHGMGYVVPCNSRPLLPKGKRGQSAQRKGQEGNRCLVEQQWAKGSWHQVMQLYDDTEVKDSLFSITLNHGVAPQEASYLYFLLPDITPTGLKRWDARRITLLRNDRKIQALSHDDVAWVAVKEPDTLLWSGRGKKSIDVEFISPGLYRIEWSGGSVGQIMACDPTRQLEHLQVKINGKIVTIPNIE